MFNTYNPYTNGYAAPPTAPQYLNGRQVASVDEVRAARVDFTGMPSYYPCPSQNAIYVKYLDMSTGSAVILEYRPHQVSNPPQYADMNVVSSLDKRLTLLEQQLGVKPNEPANDNAVIPSHAGGK